MSINRSNIKYIFVDIDGVLTDGRFSIDENGNEIKQLCFRDLDAIGIGRKAGMDFMFVTGEDNNLVHAISKRFDVSEFVVGAKDKLSAIKKIIIDKSIDRREICYIGDSDRDAPALAYVGMGVAPADATKKAAAAALYQTVASGGFGVLFEVVENLIENTESRRNTNNVKNRCYAG